MAAFGHLIERHHNLVCAIAYSRTGDRVISEDVAQETFLIAWRGLTGLREPEKLRSWLCGIARNIAEKATRSRRREVVDVATIEGDLPGGDDPLNALLAKEVETTVWSALEELPEIYREPLVLFYREQQSIRQVAEGLGLSEDTAKQRLSRGRQSLRDSVAELVEKTLTQSRPRKAAAAAVVAAILAAQSATPAAAAVRVAEGGGRSIRVKLVMVGAVTCIAAAVAVGVVSRRSPQTAGPGDDDQQSLVARLRGEHEAVKSRANGNRSCQLRGTVKRADGSPLPGGLVALVEYGYQTATLAPVFVETGANGSWTHEVTPGRYAVTVSAPGQRAHMVTATCAPAGSAEVVTDLATAGSTLRGTVSDSGGGPIAGAVVWLFDTERMASIYVTRTAADGSYELGVNPGLYSALAYHPDYVLEVRPITFGAAGMREDITMVPGGSIEGTVVDDAGAPVAGARVFTVARPPRALAETPVRWVLAATYGGLIPAVTDSAGRFELRGLPPGPTNIAARSGVLASPVPASVDLTLAQQQTGVALTVKRARTISGFVVGDQQRGIGGVEIFAIDEQAPVAMPLTATTDESGFFELAGLGSGSYRIAAVARGWVPKMSDTLTVATSDVEDHIIALDRGATLRGRIEPAAPASVKLQPAAGDATAWVTAALTRADIDERGNFTIEGVAPGEYTLVATSFEGRGEHSITVGDRAQSDLVITLASRPSLAGRVLDGSGAPLAGALVSATPQDQRDISPFAAMFTTVRTDPRGAFRIVGVSPGVYDVRVFDDHGQRPWAGQARRPFRPRIIEVGTGTSPETLEVQGDGRRITGIVVGADQQPVADAWIEVRARGARSRPTLFPAPPIVSAANGRFEIDGVFGDEILINATGPDGTLHASAIASTTGPTTLVLVPLATLEGTVSAGGQSVTELEVRLENAVTEEAKYTRGNAGRFSLEAVVGEHELIVTSAAGYAKQTVDLRAHRQLDVTLAPWATVRGRVVREDGTPWVGASVLASDNVAPTLATTDATGAFSLSRLSAGPHTLTIRLDDELVRYDVELAPGQILDLETIDGTCRSAFGCFTPKTTASRSADLGAQFYVSPLPPTADKLAAVTRDPLQATREGTEKGAGLWLVTVEPMGEAARAGLRAGDRITAVGMSTITDGRSAVAMLMSLCQPWRSRGRAVAWKVIRDGRELTIDVLVK